MEKQQKTQPTKEELEERAQAKAHKHRLRLLRELELDYSDDDTVAMHFNIYNEELE